MNKALVLLKGIIFIEFITLFILQVIFAFQISNIFYSLIVCLIPLLSFILYILFSYHFRRLQSSEEFMINFLQVIYLFVYPIKQLLIYYYPNLVDVYVQSSTLTNFTVTAVTEYLLIEYSAYFMILIGFYIGSMFLSNTYKPYLKMNHLTFSALHVLIITALIFSASTLIIYQYGIVMGRGGVSLPFRLSGITQYSFQIMVPFLLLYTMLLYGKQKNVYYTASITILFILYVAADMGIRLSRGGLIYVVLLLIGFAVGKSSEQTRRLLIIGLLSIGMTLIMFPIATAIRAAYLNGVWNWDYIIEVYVYYSEIVYPLLLMRFTGAEMFGLAVSTAQPDLANIFTIIDTGITYTFTQEILGYQTEGTTGFAPSFLGELYIIAGIVGVLIGTFIIALLLIVLNRVARKYFKYVYPVMYAFLFVFAVKTITGGVYSSQLLILGLACIFAFAVEIISRNLVVNYRKIDRGYIKAHL